MPPTALCPTPPRSNMALARSPQVSAFSALCELVWHHYREVPRAAAAARPAPAYSAQRTRPHSARSTVVHPQKT